MLAVVYSPPERTCSDSYVYLESRTPTKLLMSGTAIVNHVIAYEIAG